MRKLLICCVLLALFGASCASDDPLGSPGTNGDPSGTSPGGGEVVDVGDDVVLTASLVPFTECDSLLTHLQTEASDRVGPYGLDGSGPIYYGLEDDVAVAESVDDSAGDAAAPAATSQAVEGVDFSGTNVQEAGIDEADIIKTDGDHAYVVSGNELVIVDLRSTPPVVSGRVTIEEGYNPQMFINGEDILLMTQPAQTGIGPDVLPAQASDSVAYYGGAESTMIQHITTAGTPAVAESLQVDGSLVSARAIDGVARIVIRSNAQLPFVFPQNDSGTDAAEAANRTVIEESTLATWLPSYTRKSASGSIIGEGQLTTCDRVHAPTEFAGFGVLSVLTVPVDGDLDPSATTSVLAPAETVYASDSSLYVATTNWIDPVLFEQQSDQIDDLWSNRSTSIHRFDISSPDDAVYAGSGSVAGTILNQFALSEDQGNLRVVTTSGTSWGEQSESFVRVLQPADNALVEVGSVGNIGNGEQVQSVRFDGTIGYVVTFRQVDPFYTIDLADPTNPVVVGELKIPGFSSYLHPIGDGLVIGVGSDASEDGRVTGSKVSLFDVTDLANPTELAVWTAPNGWNNVGWDHHSFLYWAPEQLAVVPVQVYDGNENWAGAVALKITREGITEVGRIDHADPGTEPGQTDCQVLPKDDNFDPNQSYETELGYMLAGDSGGLVLVCGVDDQGGASGYDCGWTIGPEELANRDFASEADLAKLPADMGPTDRLEVCWPSQQLDAIVRSMVVGDQLYTLSFPWGDTSGTQTGRLQGNNLGDLARSSVTSL